jgi:hypothetical protein
MKEILKPGIKYEQTFQSAQIEDRSSSISESPMSLPRCREVFATGSLVGLLELGLLSYALLTIMAVTVGIGDIMKQIVGQYRTCRKPTVTTGDSGSAQLIRS